MDNNTVSLISLGGVGNVTRNMYVYEYQKELLLVDCGLGFADESMLGIDLLIPDISYLQQAQKMGKKIVGMLITHGHEDHMGALPFILPQLPDFPIYATPLTASLINEKLQEFGIAKQAQSVALESDHELHLGAFSAQFIRVTHSVPDTAHILIRTPIGNFYHGSDFKFDLTPFDGKKSDFAKIVKVSQSGIVCMTTDCLGAERPGTTPSEYKLTESIFREMERTKGKFVVTTYSSNINRINQVIQAAEKLHRHICFVGRSLMKAVEVGKKMGLIKMPKGMEVRIDQLRQQKDNQLVLVIAGSQGQENSALTRVATGIHKDIKLTPSDTVVFSSDPIPGNEIMVTSLVDTLSRIGAKVLYSDISSDFHVSGHASAEELLLLMELVKPKKILPIGGNFKHMAAYQQLAMKVGYQKQDVLLPQDGQQLIFSNNGVSFGKVFPMKNVYVDELSGEEVEGYVLRDRQKLSQDGVLAIMVEIDSSTGSIANSPDIIIRGFAQKDAEDMRKVIIQELNRSFSGKMGKVTNWILLRKSIGEIIEKRIYKEFRRRPLLLPVVIEV